MATIRIPLNSRKYPDLFAIIDEEDYAMVREIPWSPHKSRNHTFYAASTGGIRMHRIILGASRGDIVDHIDGDGLNNVRANLRIVDIRQNNQNVRKRKMSKHGFRGVYRTRGGNWAAAIRGAYIGSFPTKIEAALAYDEKAIEMFGEGAMTNRSLGLIALDAVTGEGDR